MVFVLSHFECRIYSLIHWHVLPSTSEKAGTLVVPPAIIQFPRIQLELEFDLNKVPSFTFSSSSRLSLVSIQFSLSKEPEPLLFFDFCCVLLLVPFILSLLYHHFSLFLFCDVSQSSLSLSTRDLSLQPDNRTPRCETPSDVGTRRTRPVVAARAQTLLFP